MTKLFKKFNDNRGLSLVELIVTIAILAIVTAGLGTAMVSASKSYSKGSADIDVQSEVQNVTNIITNIVIDSADVVSDVSGLHGSANEMMVKSIDGTFYFIGLDSTDGTLYYNKLTAAAAAGMDDTTAYSTVKANANILASNVISFTADTSMFSTNYTVHVTIDIHYPSTDREMKSSFSVTSRNAAAAEAAVEVAKTAVIITDAIIVIEPRQGEANDSITAGICHANNSYAIDYKILTTGGASAALVAPTVHMEPDKNSATVSGLDITVTGSQILIKCGQDFSGDAVNGDAYIYLSTSDGFYKWVTVHVRRVTDIIVDGNPYNTDTSKKYNAGARYEIYSSVVGTNLAKYFAFNTDNCSDGGHGTNCRTAYISPYSVAWFLDTNGYNKSDLVIVRESDNANVTSDFINNKYIGTADDKFIVTLNADLPSKASITLTGRALHPEGNYEGERRNKSDLKYLDPTQHKESSYVITNFNLFGDPVGGFKRGNALVGSFGLQNVDDAIEYIYMDRYKDYADKIAKGKVAPGSSEYLAYQDYINFVDNVVKANKNNLRLDKYFSIYEYDVITEKVDTEDGVVYTSYEITKGWSQFRNMNSGVAYRLSEAHSARLVPDTYQTIKFEAVLRDKDSGLIYWPYDLLLIEKGFGPKKQCNGISTAGTYADYVKGDVSKFFAKYAELVTDNPESYSRSTTIEPFEMLYKANSEIGVPAGATAAGSAANPITLDQHGNSFKLEIDLTNWPNLGNNWFMNNQALLLQYRQNNGTWTNALTIAANYTNYAKGAFNIKNTNATIEVIADQNQVPVDDRVYRLIPAIFKEKRYIDEVNHNVDNGDDGYVLTSPDKYLFYINKTDNMYSDGADGAIYFKAFSDSAKKTIILDANGGYFTDSNGNKVTTMEYSFYPKQNVKINDMGALKDLTKLGLSNDGHTLRGWSDSPSYYNNNAGETMTPNVNNGTVFYASWN